MLNTDPMAPPAAADHQAKMTRAAIYRAMVESAAWRDLKETVLERIRVQAIKDEDNVPIDQLQLSMAKIAECRGKRIAIDKILRDVENILQPL